MSDFLRVVTIDGPSGGGKSTVSRLLAAKLGFTYLDTGAMYRAVAYSCQQADIDLENESGLTDFLNSLHITLSPAEAVDSDVGVQVNGKEVGVLLRTPEMGMLASKVSAHPPVRTYLTTLQQEIGAGGNIVAEGRDIGTVVFPQAAWKFYLDAQPEVRMRRRAAQLREQGVEVDEQQLLDQIIKRDKDDSERTIAPLKQAPDALYIDSSGKSVEKVLELMQRKVEGKK